MNVANIAKELLSGSTNGRPIAVAATTSGGADTIHTAPAGTGSFEEVWLWATNTHTAEVTFTLCFGGTSAGDLLTVTIPAKTTQQVAPGLPLNGGLVVKAFASVTAVVNVAGFVNRLS